MGDITIPQMCISEKCIGNKVKLKQCAFMGHMSSQGASDR